MAVSVRADDERGRSWRRTAWLVGSLSFALLVLAGGAIVYRIAQHRADVARLADAQRALTLHYTRTVWRRPVLRGNARSCNALDVAAGAVVAVRLPRELDIIDALERGTAPSRDAEILLTRYADRLSRVRQSTRCNRSFLLTPFAHPAFGSGTALDALDHYRTVQLLLLPERDAPDRCLTNTADAIRAAQDLVPGGDALRVTIAAQETLLALKVAERCASRATTAQRARARGEFSLLSSHPPPIGKAIGLSSLLDAHAAHAELILLPPTAQLPWPGRAAAQSPAAQLDAWRFFSSEAEHWVNAGDRRRRHRGSTPEREVTQSFERHVEARKRHPNPLVAEAPSTRWLASTARAVAAAQTRLARFVAQLSENPPDDGPRR